jgi:hypothetical protein
MPTKIQGNPTITKKMPIKIKPSVQYSKRIGYLANNWNIINIDTIEMASTKTSIIAMPINIFEAAEGFRLKALITEYPRTAITIDGPSTAINMTVRIIKVSANIFPFDPFVATKNP